MPINDHSWEGTIMAEKLSMSDLAKELGISKTASIDDIKTAYRKLALAHHPDRHANLTDEKKIAESDLF